MATHTPGPAQLLSAVGEDDTAAFAALYDLTVPHVFGQHSAEFPHEEDALQATTDTYIALWRQAAHFTFDFNVTHADEQARDRTVMAWITALAQSTGSEHHPDAEQVHGPDRFQTIASKLDELAPLTQAQALALTTVWLGGRTVDEAAQELGVSLPTLKSRLRDATVRMTRHYLASITGNADTDPLLTTRVTGSLSASDGQTAAFSEDIGTELQVGLGSELVTLQAIHALDEADTVAVEAWIHRQDRDVIAQCRARIALFQRMLSWAFRRVALQPPAYLLDSILDQLPAQHAGLEFVDEIETVEEDPQQQRRNRTVFLVIGGVLLLAVLIAIIVLTGGDQRIRHAVDDAEDTVSVTASWDGARVVAHVSEAEDLAYVSFAHAPELDDQVYQVWLFDQPGGAAVSAGTFSAEELQEDGVQFRGVNAYELLWVTAEPETGSEYPSGSAIIELALQN